jgi:hypothetical protein
LIIGRSLVRGRTIVPRASKRSEPDAAEIAQGFEAVLMNFRGGGGQEIELASLQDLEMVSRVRSLPILKHAPDGATGWVYYLVLDGANRLAYRVTVRKRAPDG